MKKAICLSIICLVVFGGVNKLEANQNDLVISEIMYDLSGADAGREWIEVYNSGQDNVEVLTGAGSTTWRFFDGTNHTLSLVQGEDNLIAPQEFFIIAADANQFLAEHQGFVGTVFDTVMSLNNTSSSIALSFDAGQTQNIFASYDAAWGGSGSGFSLEKISLSQDASFGNWQESSVAGGTPGQANSNGQNNNQNLTPTAVASCPNSLLVNVEGNFDASASYDPQNLPLSYYWDFGDTTNNTQSISTHAFSQTGNYQVSLTVSNGNLSAVSTCAILVTEEDPEGPEEPEENSGGGSGYPDNNWDDILISEFLPNPKGTDDHEWIELYNNSNQTIDLSGFKLQDNSARIFTINDELNLSIQAKKYLLLDKSITGISLNNTGGDSVKLYNPDGELIEKIEYQDTAQEDKSYARKNNDFIWTSVLTPELANIFVENLAPLAKITLKSKELLVAKEIILSAENSSDPEEGSLQYEWDFGDETQGDEKIENHVYQSPGKYLVKLKVMDGENLFAEESLLVEILALEGDLKINDVAPINFALENLIISEFIPNPVGSDDNEWVELYNNHTQSIELLGWFLDDQDGGSKPHLFSSSTVILPGEFKVFSRLETGLTLNNSNDSVRLLTPLKEVWQEATFDSIKEGESYAWDFENQEWFVSTSPSPGLDNFIRHSTAAVAGFSILDTTAIYEMNKKDKVILQGLVINDADSESASLYLTDWEQDNIFYDQIVEIYFSQKDWPAVKSGDLIEVSGEISKTSPLPRVKIKSKDDISVTDFHMDLNAPALVDLEELSEELVGDFITVRGVVSKKSGKNIYLSVEQEAEANIRLATNFSLADFDIKKGKEVVASGILSLVNNNFKLSVLSVKDLALTQEVIAQDLNESEDNFGSSTYQIEQNFRKEKVKKISLIIFFISGVFVFIYFLKNKFYKG